MSRPLDVFIHVLVLAQNEGHERRGVCGIDYTFFSLLPEREFLEKMTF